MQFSHIGTINQTELSIILIMSSHEIHQITQQIQTKARMEKTEKVTKKMHLRFLIYDVLFNFDLLVETNILLSDWQTHYL